MKTGPLTLLCLTFIALKLSGHIAWGWWRVMAPMWMPFCVMGAMGFVVYKLEGKKK